MDTPLLEPALQYEAELDALVTEIKQGMDQLKTTQGRPREDMVATLKRRITHGETLFRTVQIESRDLDPTRRKQVQQRSKNLHAVLKQLQTDLMHSADRGELLGGREMSRIRGGDQEAPPMSTRQALASAKVTQEDSMDSLERSKRLVAESEEYGTSTISTLGQQRDQLLTISKNLDDLQDDIQQSKKLMSSFLRRMTTDRIVQCFLLLIVLGIVFIIIYKVVKK